MVSVDNRLVEYWRRQLAARRRPRAAPAVPEPADPVTEPQNRGEPAAGEAPPSNVVPMTFEDR
jgi:hypothetical protein